MAETASPTWTDMAKDLLDDVFSVGLETYVGHQTTKNQTEVLAAQQQVEQAKADQAEYLFRLGEMNVTKNQAGIGLVAGVALIWWILH